MFRHFINNPKSITQQVVSKGNFSYLYSRSAFAMISAILKFFVSFFGHSMQIPGQYL
jgi:hypothetical protein